MIKYFLAFCHYSMEFKRNMLESHPISYMLLRLVSELHANLYLIL